MIGNFIPIMVFFYKAKYVKLQNNLIYNKSAHML